MLDFHKDCAYLSALERFATLISAHYGWHPPHALLFLFGHAPPIGLLRVHYHPRPDLPCLTRIVIEAEPSMAKETVAELYEKARTFILPSGAKPKSVGVKHAALASLVYSAQHGIPSGDDDLLWLDLIEIWNPDYAPLLRNQKRGEKAGGAEYRYVSHFIRDAKEARRRLLEAEYGGFDSEALFIAGDRLVGLDIIGRAEA